MFINEGKPSHSLLSCFSHQLALSGFLGFGKYVLAEYNVLFFLPFPWGFYNNVINTFC